MPNDLNFFDKLRTRLRLFLMGNREIIAIFGILVLTASVIYSTKLVSFPTRVPTRATESASGGPTPTLVPTITTITTPTTFPTATIPKGFLELLQISPVPTPTPSVPIEPTSTPTPATTSITTITPVPTTTPVVTIFLPPIVR